MSEWSRVIAELHESRWKVALATTAGGSAISRLLESPGASATLLELTVSYAASAMHDLLGHTPEQFCSAETALAMASVTYRRGVNLENGECQDVIGVGVTASLASDRTKRGRHRCYIATQTSESTRLASVVMCKGLRDRGEEDRLVGNLILDAIATTAGIADRPRVALTNQDDIQIEVAIGPPEIRSVWLDARKSIWRLPDGQFTDDPSPAPVGLLCGSFNPRHAGHDQLRSAAERKLNGSVYFEMTINNADKPPLDFLTLQRRCEQFDDVPLLLTSVPTFAERA
ncbi:MAG: CinA family protein, partial [Planctomycetota bacterium]|nr:CinA family protein [Planctomycetota bacterium]